MTVALPLERVPLSALSWQDHFLVTYAREKILIKTALCTLLLDVSPGCLALGPGTVWCVWVAAEIPKAVSPLAGRDQDTTTPFHISLDWGG